MLLQPGVLRLEFLEPFRVRGFHAAVLGEPTMPRRLRNLQMPAHLVEPGPATKQLVALGKFADDLIRRMPPALVRCHVDTDSSCPETGQQSRTPTGPLQRAHLIGGWGGGDGDGVEWCRVGVCDGVTDSS